MKLVLNKDGKLIKESRSPDPSEPGATNRELNKSLGPGDNAKDNDSGSPLTKAQQKKANAGIRRWKQSYDTKKFRKHLGQPENRDKGFGKLHQKEKNFNLKQTLRKKKVNEGSLSSKKGTKRRMKVMAHRGASTPSIVKRFLAHRKSKKASPKGEKQERGTPLNKFVDKFGTGK